MTPALLLTLALSAAGFAQDGKVIYGEDGRLDVHQAGEKLRKLAESTVALFSADHVRIDEQNKVAELTTASFGEEYTLCPDEPFREQRTGGYCSGSLVAPDIVMTAGHCIGGPTACEGTKFVFGFGIREAGGQTPQSVPAADVYGCGGYIGGAQVSGGPDWALVRLDRPVSDRAPLRISRRGMPPKGTPLFVIGHPAGLPTKVAGGASVRESGKDGYFTANLDTYGGNSGSAVFNAVTGEVEGILVRGETDWRWENGCRRSNRVPDGGGRGEDVTEVGIPAKLIPDRRPATAFEREPGPAYSALLELL
jgi:hypothetical protein